MFSLESTYWWYVGRTHLVSEIVRRALAGKTDESRVLDVGCGTGANAVAISRIASVVAVDASSEALALCKQRGELTTANAMAETLPFASGTFDVVMALDVLEHLDDDVRALVELARVCSTGGALVATVPAYGFLWSEHDEALHHRRRYTAHELRNKLTVAGWDVVRSSYFVTLLFFPILAFRIWNGLFKKNVVAKSSHVILPRWLNHLFLLVLRAEAGLYRLMNLPFGVTCIVVATPASRTVRHER